MNERVKIVFHFGLIAVIGFLLGIVGVLSSTQVLVSGGIILFVASAVVIGFNLGKILADRIEKNQSLPNKEASKGS